MNFSFVKNLKKPTQLPTNYQLKTPDNVLVQIKNFTLGFENALNGKIKAILSDINLDIYKGEKLAIIGESGSGKTVLSTAIGCLLNKDAKKTGSIVINGMNVCELTERQIIKNKFRGQIVSYVFQNPLQTMNPYMKIGDQLIEVLHKNGQYLKKGIFNKQKAKRKVLDTLIELNLANPEIVYHAYPHQLSGGMIQRVVIACSLLLNPKLLILDEPTSALDAVIEIQILEILDKIAKKGTTIILISHDLNLVSTFADRIAVMYAGKILEIGTNKEINLHPQHPYTWGLLMSIPSYNQSLYSIPGRVPADLSQIKGDPFAARNLNYALGIDFTHAPPMYQVSPTHFAATWLLSKHAPKYLPPTKIAHKWAQFFNQPLQSDQNHLNHQEVNNVVNTNKKVLEIQKLNIIYSDRNSAAHVVKDVDLHINEGEIVGLIGESGSGKSTIAKAIAGLVDFTADRVQILGVESPRDVSEIVGEVRTRYARSLQMIYQNPAASLNSFKKVWKVVGESLFHHAEFLSAKLGELYDQKIAAEHVVDESKLFQQRLKVNQLNKQLEYAKKAYLASKKSFKSQMYDTKQQLNSKLQWQISERLEKSYLRFLSPKWQKLLLFNQWGQFYKIYQNFWKYKKQAAKKLAVQREHQLEAIKRLQQQILEARKQLQAIYANKLDLADYHHKNAPLIAINQAIAKTLKAVPKIHKDDIYKLVISALKQVGLTETHMEMYSWQLSGGQQQRAAIARSLILKPKLLIADEPIASLDVSLQSGIISLISKLMAKYNMATLFISHDLEMLSHIANRVYVLYQGRVVEQGDTLAIFTNPIHPYTKMLVSCSQNKGYDKDLSKIFVFDPKKHYHNVNEACQYWQIGTKNHYVYARAGELAAWTNNHN